MKFLIFSFFMGIFFTLQGEQPHFDVKITPAVSEISIKDVLEVTLDFTFPDDYQVDLSTLQQNIIRSSNFYEHPFAIANMQVDPPVKNEDGSLSQHVIMKLQPLREGDVNLTFYDIPFLPKDKLQKPHKVISPIFPIHVLAFETPTHFQGRLEPLLTFSKTFPLELDEKNQSHQWGDPAAQKMEQRQNAYQMNIKQLPWIEAGSLLLMVLLFWIFLKNPPHKPALTPEQIAQAAKAQALIDLENLKEQQLPEKGFFNEYYVQLTQPVRAYIEQKYNVIASTQTTPEFLSSMAKNSAFPDKTRQQLGQFLSQADKVKFGNYKPSMEECDHAQALAVQFIKFDK